MTPATDNPIPPFIAGYAIGIILLTILTFCVLIILFLIAPVSAISMDATSDILYRWSANDTHYVQQVDQYVNQWITYNHTDTWAVNPPEVTWETKRGDCSEYALLKTAMLKRHGVDARVVHGTIPGVGLHDDVEIHIGKYPYTLAPEGFVTMGYGLHPREYVR